MYKVFTRNWYKADGITPDPGARRMTVQHCLTEDQARDVCREGNENRPASWVKRSRKYEYMYD